MTNPSIKELLVNCRMMDMHIRRGEKVLVHCHAGQGRTALVIACYLMFANTTETVNDTIAFIRAKRPKCLKHKFNREFLTEVHEKLGEMRMMFAHDKKHVITLRSLIDH